MDLSYWAYAKLADTKWGVIATSWQNVECGHQPTKRAVLPNWVDKKEYMNPRPAGFTSYADKRVKMVGATVRNKTNGGFKRGL